MPPTPRRSPPPSPSSSRRLPTRRTRTSTATSSGGWSSGSGRSDGACTRAARATTRSRSRRGSGPRTPAAGSWDASASSSRRSSTLRARLPSVVLPGYTHLQRAQPVLLGHYLAAHAWALERDDERLRAAYDAADVSSLGAGALAGSSLPLDPLWTADRARVRASLREQPRRGRRSRLRLRPPLRLRARASCTSRASRRRSSSSRARSSRSRELDDAWRWARSMMPQKKNPQVAEHLRGRAASRSAV